MEQRCENCRWFDPARDGQVGAHFTAQYDGLCRACGPQVQSSGMTYFPGVYACDHCGMWETRVPDETLEAQRDGNDLRS